MKYYVIKQHKLDANCCEMVGKHDTKVTADQHAKIMRVNESYNSRYTYNIMDTEQLKTNFKVWSAKNENI